ncbi:MAG: 50S ribosomal protein L25 [Candidatus Pacebacteria bacterium]|nr:50S ribosomal protein L25 [Candidatus Paceibacterota bacterium]
MTELKFIKRDAEKTSPEFLRSQGLVPAVCYGAGNETTLVAVEDVEFRKVYRKVGTSGLIDMTGDVSGEQCLVQDMQVHVVSGELQHIDFKFVAKGQATEVTVPVEIVGESPAVVNKVGLLNISRDELVIETIPSKIPESIEVDGSLLKEIGDSVKISDLKLDSAIEFTDDLDTTIVSIIAPREDEPEAETEEPVSMEPELVDQKGKQEDDSESEEA